MKKNLFWLVFGALFIVSCSSSDDSIPCETVMDCPDSSFVCLDGECVLGTAETTGDSDAHGGNGGESGTSDDNNSNVDGNNNSSDDDNGGSNGGLPDPEPSDDDTKSDSDQVNDGETTDSDSSEENDGETDDENGETTDGESGDDADNAGGSDDENGNHDDADDETGDDDIDENPVGQVTDCDIDADCASNINNKRCDTTLHKCVICVTDSDCDPALGQKCDPSTHECVSNATCAAAIAKLPHSGKYDWEDGTPQGFSTNTYWNLVESSVLPARSGNYSFGKYSQYTVDKDQLSPLSTATDLSQCAQCTVKASFYVKGEICNGNCEAQTFLHPTCNGEGNTTVIDKTSTPWSQWTIPPESPWVDDDLDFFKAKANNNQYSAVAWKDLEWTIPETCKTNQFVFGLRFRSSSLVAGPGLVVDDLTIAPAATGYVPNGEFESAANGYVKGWACDLDLITKNVLVKVEYYKNQNDSAAVAERWVYAAKEIAADPESPLATQCNATYNHGFEVPLDEGLKALLGEEGTHKAVVYAVDIPSAENLCGGTYTKLGEKEFEVTNVDLK